MEISWLYYAVPVAILTAIILYVAWIKLRDRNNH